MKSTLRNVYWTLFVVLCLVGCIYSSSRYQMAPYKFVGTNNGYFIHAIPAETIITYKKIFGFGDILPSDNPDYEKQRILMNCNADDNPIIALYKF